MGRGREYGPSEVIEGWRAFINSAYRYGSIKAMRSGEASPAAGLSTRDLFIVVAVYAASAV
jgi:hypothetical protein